jgi:hypothetical protein
VTTRPDRRVSERVCALRLATATLLALFLPAVAHAGWSAPKPLPNSEAIVAAAATSGGGFVLYGYERALILRVTRSGRPLRGHIVPSGQRGFEYPVAATGPRGQDALAWLATRADEPTKGVAIVRDLRTSEPLRAQFISTTDPVSGPVLVAGPDRSATVAWHENRLGAVRVATVPRDGAIRTSMLAAPGFTGNLQLGVDDSGRVTVTWASGRGKLSQTVASQELVAGGEFGPERSLAGVPASATILTDGRGRQVAVWSDVHANSLQAAVRTAKGGFDSAHTLDRHGRVFGVALNASGRVVVAWVRSRRRHGELRYAIGTSAGKWGESRRARTPGPLGPPRAIGSPVVALDDRGRAVILEDDVGHNRTLFARDRGRGFGRLQPVPARPGDRGCGIDSFSLAPTTGRALAVSDCEHPGAGIGGERFLRVSTYRP